MRMMLTYVIELDPELWDLAFDTGTDPGEVREDVKQYVLNLLQNSSVLKDEMNAKVTAA